MYGILADVIVAVHLAYVGYVVFGQLAIMVGVLLRWQWVRNPAFRWSHLIMICVVAVEALANFECPLTTWERDLRKAAWEEHLPAVFAAKSVAVLGSPVGQGPLLAASAVSTAAALEDEHLPEMAGTFVGRIMDGLLFPDCQWGEAFPIYYGFAALVIAFFILAPPRSRKENPGPGPTVSVAP
jgi:hypothetical protein